MYNENPFRIYGPGIYSLNQPRYKTLAEAKKDFYNYCRRVGQSYLIFDIIEDLDNDISGNEYRIVG